MYQEVLHILFALNYHQNVLERLGDARFARMEVRSNTKLIVTSKIYYTTFTVTTYNNNSIMDTDTLKLKLVNLTKGIKYITSIIIKMNLSL